MSATFAGAVTKWLTASIVINVVFASPRAILLRIALTHGVLPLILPLPLPLLPHLSLPPLPPQPLPSAFAAVLFPAPSSLVSGVGSSEPVLGEVMDTSDICDNQRDKLDSQVSLSHTPPAIKEVGETNGQSTFPTNDSDLHVTDNENSLTNRLTNANIVVSDKSVTSNVECSASDRNKTAGKGSTSSDKSVDKCMSKKGTVIPKNTVGELEFGEIPDVDMALPSSAGKRAPSDDISEPDSVDSGPVTVAPPRGSRAKKPAVVVSPRGRRDDRHSRFPVFRVPAGKDSLRLCPGRNDGSRVSSYSSLPDGFVGRFCRL